MNRKPIFDAVRKMLGRGFTQAEVDALDAACAAVEASLAGSITNKPAPKPAAAAVGKVLGPAGSKLIKSFEGCERRRADGKFEAYPDPGSVDGKPWTIGWGSTGPDIKPGTVFTQAQCDARFDADMVSYANAVSKALGAAPTTQNQFDALVSFHYNTGAIATATLTKKHKAGDFEGAKAEFMRWVRNDGKVMQGLINRRKAEVALYSKA